MNDEATTDSETLAGVYLPESKPPFGETVSLGLQHVLAMFGATVLAPILMGFDANTAILMSGVGTIIFYFIVRGVVPSYLGSSFAFIAAVAVASNYSGSGPNPNLGIALGGIMAAGLFYCLVAILVMVVGYRWIERLFPDLVSGTIVGIIGISLAGVAIGQIGSEPMNVLTASVTLGTAVLWSVYMQGRLASRGTSFLRIVEMIPIIVAAIVGYVFYGVANASTGIGSPIDFAPVAAADWVGLPSLTAPEFSWLAVLTISPVVIVLLAENLGHVKAIGAMINRDLNSFVGRTFLGDGIATILSGSVGGPGLTTYAENMAVMRLSRNFASITFVAAGCIAILLGFSPKFGAVIRTIPVPVLGGLSLAMFGLITAAAGSIWQRGIRQGTIDFLETRTLLVAGIGLVLGAGNLTIKVADWEMSGIVTATLFTVLLYHLLHIGRPHTATAPAASSEG